MKSSPNSLSSAPDRNTSRCNHSTSQGRRCRMLALPNSRYCHSHSSHARSDAAALASDLASAAASLSSPEDVHRVMATIFRALCEDRITLKKAGMLGYLAQTLVRSQHEIAVLKKMEFELKEREEKAAELKRLEDAPSSWIIPRPDRDDDPPTSPTTPSCSTPNDSSATHTTAPATSSLDAATCHTNPAPRPESTPETSVNPPNVGLAENHSSHAARFPESRGHNQTFSSAPKSPKPKPVNAPPVSLPDLNYFYPIDPTLPPGRQDHNKSIPPPDEAELRRREWKRGFSRLRVRPWMKFR